MVTMRYQILTFLLVGMMCALGVKAQPKASFDKEIYELLEENLKNEINLIDSFIESLKWRRNSISEKLFEYIDNYILKNKHLSGIFLKILINFFVA